MAHHLTRMLTTLTTLLAFDWGTLTGNAPANNGYESTANQIPNPLSITTLNELTSKIMNALTTVAVPVVIAMVMWGAFKIITSAGDAKRAKDGGMVIFYAAVGFGLLLIADGIVAIIQSLFQ
jgi:Type IV secretion system pilin